MTLLLERTEYNPVDPVICEIPFSKGQSLAVKISGNLRSEVDTFLDGLNIEKISGRKYLVNTPDGRRDVDLEVLNLQPVFVYVGRNGRRKVAAAPWELLEEAKPEVDHGLRADPSKLKEYHGQLKAAGL
jgi:hypothetical protein